MILATASPICMPPGMVQAESVPTDWFGIGLVLAIMGTFFLANAILVRNPRSLVEEHFGGGSLRSIREYIFHRVQVHLGFFFLLSGFAAQLFGHYQAGAAGPGGAPGFPAMWVGIGLLGVVVLELVGWWLSHLLFRRTVKNYFRDHPPDFETDMGLAREVGELLGLRSSHDDTVQSYIASLRRALGLPPMDRREAAGSARDLGLVGDEDESGRELG